MNKTTVPTIEDFIDKLLGEKEYPKLDESSQAKMKNELVEKASRFINIRLLASLNDEDLKKAYQLTKDKTKSKELQELIDLKVSNKEEVIAQTLSKFRELYLGVA